MGIVLILLALAMDEQFLMLEMRLKDLLMRLSTALFCWLKSRLRYGSINSIQRGPTDIGLMLLSTIEHPQRCKDDELMDL
ncbi:hypothetical protein BFX18_03370 [Vibrio cholerae]|nr:hypothetical protein DN38_2584 [Vibrio cholerae]OFI84856.1 hypothetical protein BFX18_03370 [Vibrio cholerae]OFJ12816.1 hypothetical protein BFX28_03605 [Vibrio cholerae]OFJ18619.1 hypothetical protein BFX29_03480 [Vibrio cholerae]